MTNEYQRISYEVELRKKDQDKTCEKIRCLSEATGTYSKAKLKMVKLFLQLVGAYAAAAAISTLIPSGGLLAHYHVVIISFPRFFPGNWRLGSEPADQKELIGTILKSWVPNMGLNDFSRLTFLQHSSFSFLNENKHL